MSLQLGPFSQHPTSLSLKAFFYTRTPMLLIDPGGVIVDTNAATRELLGLDLAGCKGQHYTYLLNHLRPRTEGPLLPPDGMASAHFATPGDDLYARRMPELDTVDLRAAVGECRYHSARYGPVRLASPRCPASTRSPACAPGRSLAWRLRTFLPSPLFRGASTAA